MSSSHQPFREVGRSTAGILQPVEELVPTVKRIYRDACDGWTPGRIARALNRDGIPSAQGGTSKPQAVRQILTNPAYVGERYDVRNAAKAIVSRRASTRRRRRFGRGVRAA
jgi:hypothetical protein